MAARSPSHLALSLAPWGGVELGSAQGPAPSSASTSPHRHPSPSTRPHRQKHATSPASSCRQSGTCRPALGTQTKQMWRAVWVG